MARDRVLVVLISLFGFFFRITPLRLGLVMARGAARIIFWIDPKRKFIGFANLTQAFGDSLGIEERIRILRGVYGNLAQSVVEILRFPKLTVARVNCDIQIRGLEKLHQALACGKGFIALTAHFGNWELIRMAVALKGIPTNVVAREQKMTRLNQLLNQYRQLGGCKVITKGMNLREVYRSLERNEGVAMLIDQDGGKRGVFAPLFGRPSSTKAGAFLFSQETGAPLIPVFIFRDPRQSHKHTLIFEDPLMIPHSEQDIAGVVAQYQAVLERTIQTAPDQWLWMHNRWKSSPLRKIMILDDGKKGHLKQSLAVAKLREVLQEAGSLADPLEQQVIEIRFKSQMRRILGSLLLVGLPWSLSWRWKLLRWSLTGETFHQLKSAKADIVISAGSALSAINFWLSKVWHAKNIHLMKPNLVPWNGFWRILLPRHDWHSSQPPPRRVILTATTPNLIREEIPLAVNELSKRIKSNLPKIAVLLGGDTEGYTMREEWVELLFYQLLKIAQENEKTLLVTTSRRTPKPIEATLSNWLKDDPRCEFLELANQSNQNGIVPGILGLSEIVVVTGESISMVSEAASSGKPVFVLFPPRSGWRRKRDKYQRMVESLERQGLVKRIEVEEIPWRLKG